MSQYTTRFVKVFLCGCALTATACCLTASSGEDVSAPDTLVKAAPAEKLTWAPPTLENPITIQLDTESSLPELEPGRDYIIQFPDEPRTRRVLIKGGRNVVIIGGTSKIPHVNENAFQVHRGDPGRTVHLEGIQVTYEGEGQGDALAINAPTTIVQVQNFRATELKGGYDKVHSDVIQPWGGVQELRVDRLTGSCNCQGFFLVANYNSNGSFDFRNVNLTMEPEWYPGAKSGHALWLDRGLSGDKGGPVPTTFSEVYIVPRPNRTLGNSVFPQSNAKTEELRAHVEDDYVTWPGLTFVNGGIHKGPPPGGDFVSAENVGIHYTSPGYLSE